MPIFQLERIGTYSTSILTPMAFAPPLSLSARTAPLFSCLWYLPCLCQEGHKWGKYRTFLLQI